MWAFGLGWVVRCTVFDLVLTADASGLHFIFCYTNHLTPKGRKPDKAVPSVCKEGFVLSRLALFAGQSSRANVEANRKDSHKHSLHARVRARVSWIADLLNGKFIHKTASYCAKPLRHVLAIILSREWAFTGKRKRRKKERAIIRKENVLDACPVHRCMKKLYVLLLALSDTISMSRSRRKIFFMQLLF